MCLASCPRQLLLKMIICRKLGKKGVESQFFLIDLRLVPETLVPLRSILSHFSAQEPAIRPRSGRSKFEAPQISSQVSPYGILPRFLHRRALFGRSKPLLVRQAVTVAVDT